MSIELRPEVRAYAEQIEMLLREHDAEKGDDWKRLTREESIQSLCLSLVRFNHAMCGSSERSDIAKRAASVGAHAMFAAIITGGLSIPATASTEAFKAGDRVRYAKPRYGDPPDAIGVVAHGNLNSDTVLVSWERVPFPGQISTGWWPITDLEHA